MNRVIILFFVLNFCSGCILVPFIDSYKSIGVQRGDRERLLQEELVQFNRARFWGEKSQALQFTKPESRKEIQKLLRSQKDERIVESEVEFIDFIDEGYEANVSTMVKYYRVPYYVVEDRIENQGWAFTHASGWKLQSIEVESNEVDSKG